MKIGILGGGFGIYGYLPAVCSLDWNVATLSRYQNNITSRPELTQFQNRIQYMATEDDLLSSCSSIVVARTPEFQHEFLMRYSSELNGIEHLFLEKPLTSSLENSKAVLKYLSHSRFTFSLGYLFLYTPWFERISQLLMTNGNKIVIHWSIPSPKSTWKRREDLGGGINSFFLVHFIPVFLKLGFQISSLKVSQVDGKSFLSVSDLNTIEVFADLVDRDYGFEIFLNGITVPIYQAETPFGPKPKMGVLDPRIPYLQTYLLNSINKSDERTEALKVELEVLEFLKVCRA